MRTQLRLRATDPDLDPRDEVRPTDVAPILRPVDGGVELMRRRWGFAPSRPKAGPGR